MSSTALAERLGVAPASITNMLQKLASSSIPLVEYESRRGVRLSARRPAARTGDPAPSSAAGDISLPGTRLSDRGSPRRGRAAGAFHLRTLEERIDAKLGRPKFDPHGHCIPALDGKMSKQVSKPLTDIEEDGKFVVDSVADDDAALLKQARGSWHHTRGTFARHAFFAGGICSTRRQQFEDFTPLAPAGTVRVCSAGFK